MHDRDNSRDIIEQVAAVVEEDITPRDLLVLAKWILGVVAVIFLMSGIAELFFPNCGVFESCKTILPPIATLVIGFYFGKSKG